MKPFQQQVLMIRQGITNTINDATQGPALIDLLVEKLGEAGLAVTPELLAIITDLDENALRTEDKVPPYTPGTLTGANTDLSMDHHMGAWNLSHGSVPTVTIRTDANYAGWATAGRAIFTFGRRAGAFRIVCQSGVSLGGIASQTFECPGGFARVSVWRGLSANEWDAAGDLTQV